MKLPSYVLNVLPGGKYEAMALRLKNEPDAILECKTHADFFWTNVDDPTFPFADPYEWRIRRNALRYRVALMGSETAPYTVTVDTAAHAKHLERRMHFIKWLCEWQEVEVDHA